MDGVPAIVHLMNPGESVERDVAMKRVKVDARTVSKAVDFALKELLTQVQKTGSYSAVVSEIGKQGATSLLYRYTHGTAMLGLSRPSTFYSRLEREIEDFLEAKLSKLVRIHPPPYNYDYVISRYDMMDDTCTVVVWKQGYKMTPRVMRKLCKKPLLARELA